MLAASDADADEERVGTEISRSSSLVRFGLGVETRVTCTPVTLLYGGGGYSVRTITSNQYIWIIGESLFTILALLA